jgi:hypothetical protein
MASLLTIRSPESFFELTEAIERSFWRFDIPKLMEYLTHGDRADMVLRLPTRPPRLLVAVRCGD